MTTVVFRRPLREKGPAEPDGELTLQEPPELPEVQGRDMSGMLMYLPMVAGTATMSLFFIRPGGSGGSSGLGWLAGGMMGVSVVGMVFGQLLGGRGDRKRKLNGERRDYLRYLGQIRKQVRSAADEQRRALSWRHPAPDALWTVVGGSRLWERRPTHPDFAEVRVGTGEQRLALRLSVPQTRPVEDLEPLSAGALRRFVEAFDKVRDLPMAILLRGFARVLLRGDREHTAALARSVLVQLVALHSPEDVRVAVLASADRVGDWEWVKWLPHAGHPTERDAAGPLRVATDSYADLEELLGDEELRERPRFDASATPTAEEPYVLVVVDGVPLPPGSRMLSSGYRGLTVLDVGGALPWKHDRTTLRLDVRPEALHSVGAQRSGGEQPTRIGRPDLLPVAVARRLAKQISPYRLGVSVEAVDTLAQDTELTQLLGVSDPTTVDPRQLWSARNSSWDRLRVPIGTAEDGSSVELDIKESAQGGDGPHGMLIGATGSGKSELLRTLVISLAMTHSSETLNFVLVDFKGGATFLRLDQLPHTSAVITNLADELPLVDRMQDSIHGELVRRQELLRRAELSSALDYEKARAAGAPLEPLPTLFLVIDEFSELLSVRRDFMDLFVMVGRLGRSLGVHLLLASQRLDEGRIHALEGHLSYRIALRTFSSMESRAVLGVPAAYELPSAPGNGYVKTDTATLTRFKAAYVSGPWRAGERRRSPVVVQQQVVPFVIGYVAPSAPAEPEPEPEPEDEESAVRLLDVLVDRLRGHGPAARQVWLPPLAEPPSLDRLLPPLEVDPDRGLTVSEPQWRGQLRVPVAVVDKPFEQRRELFVADLAGPAGNVGIVGGAQSGRSTAVRTLVTALALTHTPREVQVYCLDFGGGSLTGLAGLPHVGGVAGRMDSERVTRTVAEVTGLLVRREQSFAAGGIESIAEYRRLRRSGATEDPYGDVFLVVDGWFTMKEDFEPLDASIQLLASRGLTYGIHLVVTATRWMELRPWLREALGTKLELHLGDPIDSQVGARVAANVPSVPGRGLTPDGAHLLTALPRIDGGWSAEDLPEAGRALVGQVASAWTGERARPVRTLPAVLPIAELPPPELTGHGDLRVPLGLDEGSLAPVWHNFGLTPHLLVFGDTETGKTNLARAVARAVARCYTPAEARVVLADSRRGLYTSVPPETQLGYAVSAPALRALAQDAVRPMTARMPGPEITPDRLPLRDWWHGPQLFVIIDDYDLFGGGIDGPLAPLLDLLPLGVDIGLHLVVARSSSGGARAMMDPVIRRIWELATPALLLSCPRAEGPFLGDVKPKLLPPGRAQFLTRRGTPGLVQTGYMPADA